METALSLLVGTFHFTRKKERFQTILEPFQAILQIGLLRYYPLGTKIAIHNNILIIQDPTYSQPVTRWFHNDSIDDLFYLYNVFSRFNSFYSFMTLSSSVQQDETVDNTKDKDKEIDATTTTTNHKLYKLLIQNAKEGINNLIRTYTTSEKIHVLHTLKMYQSMLQNPDLVKNTALEDDEPRSRGNSLGSPIPPDGVSSALSLLTNPTEESPSMFAANIDHVFIKITSLYSQEHFNTIYNVLSIIENDKDNYLLYVHGLSDILTPLHLKIKKWVDSNIVF